MTQRPRRPANTVHDATAPFRTLLRALDERGPVRIPVKRESSERARRPAKLAPRTASQKARSGH
jgi:hypothetical protein